MKINAWGPLTTFSHLQGDKTRYNFGGGLIFSEVTRDGVQ